MTNTAGCVEAVDGTALPVDVAPSDQGQEERHEPRKCRRSCDSRA